MSVLRDHFYKLSSEVPLERIEGATKLLSELAAADKKEEWDYALSRLIKGLATSRQSARYGFSMALTELVRELVTKEDYDLTIESYLSKVMDASKVASSMKGKEVRSVLFGRLFGFQALVNSTLLLDKEASSNEILVTFVKLLVQLSGEKSWLRESALFTLCQLLTLYLASPFCDEKTTQAILQSITDEGLTFTTEGLAISLTIPSAMRSSVASKIVGNTWKHADPMARGNLPTLAKVLKDVDVIEEETDEDSKKKKNSKQKGTWSPRLPFVWELLVKQYSSAQPEEDEEAESTSKKRKKGSSSKSKKKSKVDSVVESIPLREFWKVVVDETMFAEKASPERKYWGFEIFILFLQNLPADQVEHLFTPNLMRCLINQSAQANRLLNKISTRALNTIIETSKADLNKVHPILESLIDESKGGTWNFDSITKSKVTDALIGVLGYLQDVNAVSEAEVDNLVFQIKNILITKFDKALKSQNEPESVPEDGIVHKKSNDNVLKWVLDKLLVLFRSTKRYSALKTKLMEDIFKFLLQFSFFKAAKEPNVSNNVMRLAQDRLNSFLADVISQKRKNHSWSLFCVKQLEKLEKNDDYELALELSEELQSIKQDCLDTLETIKDAMKRDSENSEKHYCFELLFSMVLIQLYTGEAETVSVLEEVKACYVDTFAKSGNDDLDTSVILTEILLSFVSRKSTLLKRLSTIVWESFLCSTSFLGELMINEKCFKLLFDVLDSKENEEGQKSLFEGEDEYAEDVSDEGDSEDDNADGDEDLDGKESDDENDDMDTRKDGDADSDEDSLSEDVDKETTIKLAKALGIPTESSGEVKFDEIDSFGDDDDQYESESMDDEQMMAIDDELARIFQERRHALSANSTSKKNADKVLAKEQMILFKNRILDLLDSFSKVQPNLVYNISFIRPLINIINLTTDKNLGLKAHKIIKTRISKVKLSEAECNLLTDDERANYKKSFLELIEWLQLQAGTYSSNQAHGSACGQSCIIVSKNLVALDSSLLPEIVAIYSKTLTTWATNSKNRIHASMFFDFVNWINSKRGNKD